MSSQNSFRADISSMYKLDVKVLRLVEVSDFVVWFEQLSRSTDIYRFFSAHVWHRRQKLALKVVSISFRELRIDIIFDILALWAILIKEEGIVMLAHQSRLCAPSDCSLEIRCSCDFLLFFDCSLLTFGVTFDKLTRMPTGIWCIFLCIILFSFLSMLSDPLATLC